jgi:hypothetical protein
MDARDVLVAAAELEGLLLEDQGAGKQNNTAWLRAHETQAH